MLYGNVGMNLYTRSRQGWPQRVVIFDHSEIGGLNLMENYAVRLTAKIESLTAQAREALEKVTIVRHFERGEHMLSPGEVCRGSYWIQRGIARKYYVNDGREVTTEFFFDDDLAISLQSYALQTAGTEYIQALTPLVVQFTPYPAFQKLKIRHPELLELDLMMTEYYAMWLEERLFQFHTMDATERYAWLLNREPHVVQQIALTHIASYLGVSLETLSRIRARR